MARHKNPLTASFGSITRTSAAHWTPEEDRLDQAMNLAAAANRLAAIIAMSQSPMAAGRYEAGRQGSELIAAGAAYITLFKNNLPHPVGLQVSAVFNGAPGTHVKLSVATDPQDTYVVDYLGNAASFPSFGKLISRTVVLIPGQTLYIAQWDSVVFPVNTADTFRLMIFDPVFYTTDDVWQTR